MLVSAAFLYKHGRVDLSPAHRIGRIFGEPTESGLASERWSLPLLLVLDNGDLLSFSLVQAERSKGSTLFYVRK